MRIGIVFTGGECLQESVFYQDIVAEGFAEGFAKGRLLQARHMLIQFGRNAFGKSPGRRTKARIEAMDSREQVEQLILRTLDVRSWDELLPDVPALKPPGRRRKRR